MMLTLITQSAPIREIQINELKLSPQKQVQVRANTHGGRSSTLYPDSMDIEVPGENWELITEWVAFHAFLFEDQLLLNWYEGKIFYTEELTQTAECRYLIDYSNVLDRVYRQNTENHIEVVEYEHLYKKYFSQTKLCKDLIKNYLNIFESGENCMPPRKIRNDSFFKITLLYSIVESIVGSHPPKCTETLPCKLHEQAKKHSIHQREWIMQRLVELINNPERADEYFLVIWEIRECIRHKTVHEGAISSAAFPNNDIGNTVYDWTNVSQNWQTDAIAIDSMKEMMKCITRYLLLNKILGLDMFPSLPKIHSYRIN